MMLIESGGKMKSKKRNFLFIILSIVTITLLHYFTSSYIWGFHDFYRRLYYIPIILAAFTFGLRGGWVTSIVITIVYAPHLFIYFGKVNIEVINQFLEISMFIIIGTITGTLVESEDRIKKLLEIQIMKLTDLENYTKNILESILNGVVAIDRNLVINSINKEGRKLLSIDGEAEKTYIYQYFEDPKEIENILRKALDGDQLIQTYETNSLKGDEGKTMIRIHGYPLKNILDRTVGMVIVMEDITEVKKLENQMKRVDKLSAVGELASGIAHEIRNPLGIIKTISQTIGKDLTDHDTREGLEIIEMEIERANRVIQELLDFAKPSVFHYKFQSIDRVLMNVLRITRKYAEQNHVTIHYQCIEDDVGYIDEEKLKQAFVNIILNDIQAMPHGGNLYIALMNDGEWLKIRFQDEGMGIEKEKLEKIFEPFYTNKEKGTGLGLAITHRIIEEHKGYIEIDSEVNVGTRMDIYLPNRGKGGKTDDEENTDS